MRSGGGEGRRRETVHVNCTQTIELRMCGCSEKKHIFLLWNRCRNLNTRTIPLDLAWVIKALQHNYINLLKRY